MMQYIRERSRGITVWILVAVIAFVFTFLGVSGSFTGDSAQVVAVVNGHKITAQEVDDYYNRWIRANAGNKEFDVNAINPIFVKQQIARGLVEQQAVITGLERDGMVISDTTLVNQIRANPNLKENDQFSIEKYKMFLAQGNISEQQFEKATRDDLLINQLQTAVIKSSFALNNQADQVIAIRNQQRDFGYTIIPAVNFKDTAKVTAVQVQKYYDDNKQLFVTPEMIKLSYVELSIDDLMKKVVVTDQNLRDYYAVNQQSFSEADLINVRHVMVAAIQGSDVAKSGEAQERIQDIYLRIKQGADFAKLAKTESDDQSSAEDNGDLGWISRNDDFPAEVYALKNPGDITQPIQTEWGWHVFQLMKRKGGSVPDFATVKDAVAYRFKREAAEMVFVTKGEELATLAFENPGSLTIVSENLDLPIKTTDFFARQGGAGIAASENVIKAAFSDEVINQKNNSDLLRISDDSYVVVRLEEIKPEYQQTLAEVTDTIKAKLQEQSAKLAAKQLGDTLVQDLKSGTLPNKATANHNLTWNTVSKVDRDDRKLNKFVAHMAFMMQRPTKQPTIEGFAMQNGDYLVIALTKVIPGTASAGGDSYLQDMAKSQIAVMEGKQQILAVQAALIEKSKIDFKD